MSATPFTRPVQIKLWQFCQNFADHFSRPLYKFIQQMLFGILKSGSVQLNSIGRSLQEHLSLKKVTQRLGIHLDKIVALVVAGIGIMNIMLVSVTERTREIGVRKSLGAKRRSILTQFLIEAVVLCNVGGIFGVLAGFGLGNAVTLFTGFAASVPMEWAFGGLAFGTMVGLTFGMWPAIVASKLDPVKALSYE